MYFNTLLIFSAQIEHSCFDVNLIVWKKFGKTRHLNIHRLYKLTKLCLFHLNLVTLYKFSNVTFIKKNLYSRCPSTFGFPNNFYIFFKEMLHLNLLFIGNPEVGNPETKIDIA